MEKRRIKYRISKTSSAPAITFVLSLVAAALLAVVYWPVFVKYARAGAAPESRLVLMTYVYGALIGCLLLFGLFTALLGKKTMVISALFSLPIFVYYMVEKTGPLFALLEGKGIADVYAASPEYFSGRNLAYIITAAAISLLAMICFLSIIFNKGRSRSFAMFLLIVCAVARVLFAVYDVRANYQPLADAGAMSGESYVYQILIQIAAAVFFFTLAVLAIELRRHFPDEEAAAQAPVSAAPAAAPLAPVSEPVAPAPVAAEPVAAPEPEASAPEQAEPAVAEPAEPPIIAAEPVEAPASKRKRAPRAKKAEAATDVVPEPAEAPAEPAQDAADKA